MTEPDTFERLAKDAIEFAERLDLSDHSTHGWGEYKKDDYLASMRARFDALLPHAPNKPPRHVAFLRAREVLGGVDNLTLSEIRSVYRQAMSGGCIIFRCTITHHPPTRSAYGAER